MGKKETRREIHVSEAKLPMHKWLWEQKWQQRRREGG